MEDSVVIAGRVEHLRHLAIPYRDEGPSKEAYERTRQSLAALLGGIEAKARGHEALQEQLREYGELIFQPLRLFVAGEFSKGKSYLINVLCGNETVRETNLGPQDTKITVLAHGDARDNTSTRYVDVKHLPFPFLKLVNLVDSPGINAALRPEHTRITQEHVASADLILFVTSAERTVSQEEAELIRFIGAHNRSEVVFIVNKMDVLEDSLIDFVDTEARAALIRFLEQILARETPIRDPLIFPVSTRRAMWAIVHRDPNVWQRSGMGALIKHIGLILQSGQAALLKLRAPLNYLEGEHINGQPILQGLNEQAATRELQLDKSRATIEQVEEDIRLQMAEIRLAIDDFKFAEVEAAFEQSLDRFLEKFLSKDSLRKFQGMSETEQVESVRGELNSAFAAWQQGVDAKKLEYAESILRRFESLWASCKQTLQSRSDSPLLALIEDFERRDGKRLEDAFDFERQNADLVSRFKTLTREIREGNEATIQGQVLDTHRAIEQNSSLFKAVSATSVLAAGAGVLADLFVAGGTVTIVSLLAGGSFMGGAFALHDRRTKRIREQMQAGVDETLERFRTSFNATIRQAFRDEADAFEARCRRLFVTRLRELVDEKLVEARRESEEVQALMSQAARLRDEADALGPVLGQAPQTVQR